MKLTVSRSQLNGTVAIPGSKSHTIRCVALAALAEGESKLIAPLHSADTLSAAACYRALGAEIDCDEANWRVRGTSGKLTTPENILDVGNSGTTARFALGSAALLGEGAAVLTGDEQIRRRPQGPLLQSLNDLGADVWSTRGNGSPPIVVRPQLRGGQTRIEAVTSQYLSALLVNCPLAEKDTIIDVPLLHERPYVEITLRYLDEQDIAYERDEAMSRFAIKGGQGYRAFTKRIPADWSSATFFLCGAAILGGQVVIEGVDFADAQGDKAVVDMLERMGAAIERTATGVIVTGGTLQGAELDLNATPDALPALAVTACFAEGPTRLVNVPQARLKETDRIAVMTTELTKMGAQIEELADGMVITPAPLRAAQMQGHDDHRVVMSLALAGMAVDGTSTIDTAEAVAITFPEYVDLMSSIGANMQTIDEATPA